MRWKRTRTRLGIGHENGEQTDGGGKEKRNIAKNKTKEPNQPPAGDQCEIAGSQSRDVIFAVTLCRDPVTELIPTFAFSPFRFCNLAIARALLAPRPQLPVHVPRLL